MTSTIVLIIICPVIAISYFAGKFKERFQWNKLIKEGKIPRPKNPNLNHSEYWAN